MDSNLLQHRAVYFATERLLFSDAISVIEDERICTSEYNLANTVLCYWSSTRVLA